MFKRYCSNVITSYSIHYTKLYDIGTGVDISIKALAETIKKIVGFEGELYFNTDKPDGTMSYNFV